MPDLVGLEPWNDWTGSCSIYLSSIYNPSCEEFKVTAFFWSISQGLKRGHFLPKHKAEGLPLGLF